ncbi:MAG: DUF4124 domain-containing protein [Halioglobus sp.]
MIRAFFVLLVSLLATHSANAEVYQCVQPETGRKYFTDKQCPDKSVGDRVQVREANADTGYASASERRAAEQERAANKLESERRIKDMVASSQAKQPQEKSASDKRMERYDQMRKKTPGERTADCIKSPHCQLPSSAPSAAAAARPIIVNPDPAGAWDTNGNRYNKGAGNTYHRTDGKTCQLLNTGMQCP